MCVCVCYSCASVYKRGVCALCPVDGVGCVLMTTAHSLSAWLHLNIPHVPLQTPPFLSSPRADNGSVRPLPCPSKKSCDGSSNATGGIGGCALGHEGPFCSLCSTNFTRFSESTACKECPSGEDEMGALAALLAIIAGGLVAVVLYAFFNHKIPKGVLKPFINGSQCKFTARRNIHTQ